jgi:hypothetical protein
MNTRIFEPIGKGPTWIFTIAPNSI